MVGGDRRAIAMQATSNTVMFTERRHVSVKHSFMNLIGTGQSNVITMFENNVGVGTNLPRAKLDVTGDLRFTGIMYDENDSAIWIPGSTLKWKGYTGPAFVLPSGATLSNLQEKASFRFIGNEVVYSLSTQNKILSPPISSSDDYKITLPQELNVSAYASETLVGELLLTVVDPTATITSTYNAFAKTTANNNQVVIRYLNGTTETSLSSLTANYTFRLQGTLTYASSSVANEIPLATAMPAKFVADDEGKVSFNKGAPPEARFDVNENSSGPAVRIKQLGTGDILQAYDNSFPALIVADGGNVGVGTAVPLSRLHVEGNEYVSGNVGVGTTAADAKLDIYQTTNKPALKVVQAYGGNASVADFYESPATTIPALRIWSNGNVGVGTALPIEQFHVFTKSRFDENVQIYKSLEVGNYHLGSFPSNDSSNIYFVPDLRDTLVSIDAATSREFPPAAVTAATTTFTTSTAGLTYGFGTYEASASSHYVIASYPAYFAFNKTVGDSCWISAAAYNATTFAYTGTAFTRDANGGRYFGEWIQLKCPSPGFMLSSYTVTPRVSFTQTPNDWWILGSLDGVDWTVLDTRTGVTWASSVAKTYTVTPTSNYYTFYRMVANKSGGTYFSLGELALFGDTTSKYPVFKRTIPAGNGVPDAGETTLKANTMATRSTPASLFYPFNQNVPEHRWSTYLSTYTSSTDATPTPSLSIKFPQPILLSDYSLDINQNIDEGPTKWNLYGQSNSSTWWQLLDSRESLTWTNSYESKTFQMPPNDGYYYETYRFDFLRNNTLFGAAMSLGGLRFTASMSNSTPSLKILNDATGGVGLGTTSPSAQLDIVGDARILGKLSCVGGYGKVKALPANTGLVNAYLHSQVIGLDGNVYHAGYTATTTYNIGGYGDNQTNDGVVRIVHLPAGEKAKLLTMGPSYSIVLTESNKIYSWGRGDQHGILGAGTITPVNPIKPVQVPTVNDPITYLETSGVSVSTANEVYRHAGYITSTGRLFVWGYNNEGQLGTGDILIRNEPYEVPKISNQNWGGFYLGMLSSFAWTDDASGNKLYACGYNTQGHLGVGDLVNKSSWTPVLKADNSQVTNVKLVRTNTNNDVTAGFSTVVMTKTGDLYTCGYNAYGRLGNGTTVNANKFVGPVLTNVVSFSMPLGAYYGGVVAVKKDGTVWVWGSNRHGCFGVGSLIAVDATVTTPTQVPGIYDAIKVYGSGPPIHGLTFLFRADGSIWFAGSSVLNVAGTIATASNITTFTKIDIPESMADICLFVDFVTPSTTRVHMLWLGDSGRLYASGNNDYGQHGLGAYTTNSSGIRPAFTSMIG